MFYTAPYLSVVFRTRFFWDKLYMRIGYIAWFLVSFFFPDSLTVSLPSSFRMQPMSNKCSRQTNLRLSLSAYTLWLWEMMIKLRIRGEKYSYRNWTWMLGLCLYLCISFQVLYVFMLLVNKCLNYIMFFSHIPLLFYKWNYIMQCLLILYLFTTQISVDADAQEARICKFGDN